MADPAGSNGQKTEFKARAVRIDVRDYMRMSFDNDHNVALRVALVGYFPPD
jgi:hypothetical protein